MIRDARTQANKDKIRHLKLRFALTGMVKKPPAPSAPERTRGKASATISDDAALAGYLQEPPKLYRLRKKSKPPEGYAMYGPLDVHDAIEEYMRVEPPSHVRPQGKKP